MKNYIGKLKYKTTQKHAYHEEGKIFENKDIFAFHAERDPEDAAFVAKQDLIAVASYDGPIKIVNFDFY